MTGASSLREANLARSDVIVVGLGPGRGDLMTRQVWSLLRSGRRVFLRTAHHPAVADLPAEVAWESFDSLYDQADSFTGVYATIAAAVLDRAASEPVIYAVPGHPTMGEASVIALQRDAVSRGISLSIVPAMSFVEPTLTALQIDGLDGLQIFDALELADRPYLPLNPDLPTILAQVYSRTLTSAVKLSLMSIYPDEHQVALVHAAGGDDERVEWLPLYAIDRSQAIAHLTSLYLPPLPHPASLATLAETVAILRGPGGCPWDQEQTAQSLRPGFLEEMAEVLEALDDEDDDHLREELGDLLFHIVIQAQIATENEAFSLAGIIASIDAKLKRRHPHVWGDVKVEGTADVLQRWEVLKASERTSATASLLDGIPRTLPALASSQKIQKRVRQIGFDWPDIAGVFAKLDEEQQELRAARTPANRQAELGDLLFTAVSLALWLDLDAEVALREANRRFARRFRRLEDLAGQEDIDLADASLTTLNRLWDQAKRELRADDPDAEEDLP